MPNIIALLLWFACGLAAAADVSLVGVIGGKAAVVVLDGGEPKTVKVGQTWNGLTVLSVDKDSALMEIEGTRRVLQQGQHYRRAVPASDHAQVTLAAGPGGHFVGAHGFIAIGVEARKSRFEAGRFVEFIAGDFAVAVLIVLLHREFAGARGIDRRLPDWLRAALTGRRRGQEQRGGGERDKCKQAGHFNLRVGMCLSWL